MGIQAALARQITVAYNSTYANEFNWQKQFWGIPQSAMIFVGKWWYNKI